MSKNDITGDKLISKVNNKAFDEGFERIFGKKLTDADVEVVIYPLARQFDTEEELIASITGQVK